MDDSLVSASSVTLYSRNTNLTATIRFYRAELHRIRLDRLHSLPRTPPRPSGPAHRPAVQQTDRLKHQYHQHEDNLTNQAEL
jgi:hypothetical protein